MKEEIYDEEDVELGRDVQPPGDVLLRVSREVLDSSTRAGRLPGGWAPRSRSALRGVASLHQLRAPLQALLPLPPPLRRDPSSSASDCRAGSLSSPLLLPSRSASSGDWGGASSSKAGDTDRRSQPGRGRRAPAATP
mmetsp:Transcript_41197/g.128024  ORF Transcript_41197/g.128024 Transcript_41197/m.128024 type:complete len:137 (+) Transcript_41197:3-413(+)